MKAAVLIDWIRPFVHNTRTVYGVGEGLRADNFGGERHPAGRASRLKLAGSAVALDLSSARYYSRSRKPTSCVNIVLTAAFCTKADLPQTTDLTDAAYCRLRLNSSSNVVVVVYLSSAVCPFIFQLPVTAGQPAGRP